MAVTPEQIQALADAVWMWRMQESIMIAFYVLYLYCVLTTLDEEVSVILPQKWGQGRLLYTLIRYGFVASISLQFSRDFRNYYSITPTGCKAMIVIQCTIRDLVVIAGNAALGLCLGALLQLSKRYLVPLLLLCVGPSTVALVFDVVPLIQYPASPLSSVDEALGYPCYYVSDEEYNEVTIINAGRVVREYLHLSIALLLVLVGITAQFTHYKGQRGRLVQVIRRDGGVHYIFLLVFRLASALMSTPAIAVVYELQDNWGVILFGMMNICIPPILAQRLLINVRNIDYMGSEPPAASKLLFAPPEPGSDDSFDDDLGGSLRMANIPSRSRYGGTRGTNLEAGAAGGATSKA